MKLLKGVIGYTLRNDERNAIVLQQLDTVIGVDRKDQLISCLMCLLHKENQILGASEEVYRLNLCSSCKRTVSWCKW